MENTENNQDNKTMITPSEHDKLEIYKAEMAKHHRKTVMVAASSAFLVLIIAAGLVYTFRSRVFSAFARNYISQNMGANAVGANSGEALFSTESIVTNAVKKANPAVVAITISKNVPKYETYYNTPFNDPFGFFFPTPQQRQNGTQKQDVGSGSGFLVSTNGYIVTNRHVAEDKTAEYTVNLNDGRKKIAKVIAVDQVYDIAIIKIEGNDYPYLNLSDSDTLELGSSVIAIGNALGEFKNTVSLGVVSGLSRSIIAGDGYGQSEQLEKVIQTDAAINPGNSGGPLLNLNGEVIGVNVAVAQGSQNIGFALPINSVKGIIDSVKTTGKIVRPYVGIRYIKVTPELAAQNKLSVDYGVLVKRSSTNDPAINKGSPAEKAGIQEDDVIIEVDGKKLDEDQSLSILIREHKVGDKLTFKLLRKGVEKTVAVTLVAAPEE